MVLKRMQNPESVIKQLRGWALGSLVILILAPTLLLGNTLQVLSVLLLPLSRKACSAANRFVANAWWGLCVVLVRGLHGTQVVVTGDELPRDENALIMVNHQGMADIPVLFDIAWDHGHLGDLKWYVKDPLKWVPGIGWGMVFLGCIFVKRRWTEDRDMIRRIFERIVRIRIPVWVISFAEGTRITPAKRERSRAYAEENGRQPLEHLLLPRTKGIVATLDGLQGHLGAVYDMTIGYTSGTPNLWQWVQGHVKSVHLHVRRYAVQDLPKEVEAVNDWIHDRFVEKDRFLNSFYQTGRFA